LKKLAAILLLTLFLFNAVGYRLFIDYAQDKLDAVLEARLDKGYYHEEELITVKTPIHLPYQTNWKEFERVDGEVNVNGVVYKYVKRKLLNDTMIFLCIPHEEKTQFQARANDFFGKTNDLPGSDNSKKTEVIKQLLSDFDLNEQYKLSSISISQLSFGIQPDAKCLRQCIPMHGQPPDIIA